MRFISLRDLRNHPGAVRRRLKTQHDLVLTSNGRPIAVMVEADEDTLEDTLSALRQAQAKHALSRMHKLAAAQGLDRISDEEIREEVAVYRASRRPSRPRR